MDGGQIFCVFFFPFGIESGMWDVIVLIPDYCLSIYFPIQVSGFANKTYKNPQELLGSFALNMFHSAWPCVTILIVQILAPGFKMDPRQEVIGLNYWNT